MNICGDWPSPLSVDGGITLRCSRFRFDCRVCHKENSGRSTGSRHRSIAAGIWNHAEVFVSGISSVTSVVSSLLVSAAGATPIGGAVSPVSSATSRAVKGRQVRPSTVMWRNNGSRHTMTDPLDASIRVRSPKTTATSANPAAARIARSLTSPDRAWVGGLGGVIDARMPFWRGIMDGEERSVVRSGGHPRGES